MELTVVNYTYKKHYISVLLSKLYYLAIFKKLSI